MIKKIVLISLIFLFISWIAIAQEIKPRLAVAPHTFEFEVSRGEILENKIKVLNQSELAIPMATRISDFTAAEETGQMIFDEASQDPSFASRFWIKIENPNFILDPGETEEVKFSIEVPENAEPGGKYAVVLFEPQLPSFYFKEGQPRTIPVIGVLFLFSVKVEGLERTGKPLTIAEFSIPENLHLKRLENLAGLISETFAAEKRTFLIVEKSKLPFTLLLKNEDIYHIKPEGKLEVLKENGKIVGETEIKEITILPGKTRKFPVEFKPDLPGIFKKYLPASISNFISKNFLFGQYKAHLFLKTEDNIIEKDVEFWAFPWKITLLTVLICCIVLTFLIKYRKRIKSAVLILFRGIKSRESKIKS